VCCLREILHGRLEEGVLVLCDCRSGAVGFLRQSAVVAWSDGAGVGEEEVDVALFFTDLGCDPFEVRCGRDVAEYWFDRAVYACGCGFRSVGIESSGGVES
jgi:hypothetical protein